MAKCHELFVEIQNLQFKDNNIWQRGNIFQWQAMIFIGDAIFFLQLKLILKHQYSNLTKRGGKVPFPPSLEIGSNFFVSQPIAFRFFSKFQKNLKASISGVFINVTKFENLHFLKFRDFFFSEKSKMKNFRFFLQIHLLKSAEKVEKNRFSVRKSCQNLISVKLSYSKTCLVATLAVFFEKKMSRILSAGSCTGAFLISRCTT